MGVFILTSMLQKKQHSFNCFNVFFQDRFNLICTKKRNFFQTFNVQIINSFLLYTLKTANVCFWYLLDRFISIKNCNFIKLSLKAAPFLKTVMMEHFGVALEKQPVALLEAGEETFPSSNSPRPQRTAALRTSRNDTCTPTSHQRTAEERQGPCFCVT